MNIPSDVITAFQQAQSSIFETSSIDYHAESVTTDTHNSKMVKPASVKTGTLSDCSIDEGLDDMEITAWGLKPGQAIVIRYSGTLPFTKGYFVKYGGKFYRVEAVQSLRLSETAFCKLWIT